MRDRVRRMREIRTSGATRGRGEDNYGMRLLRHERETGKQNYAETYWEPSLLSTLLPPW